jgi:hypothetical protein
MYGSKIKTMTDLGFACFGSKGRILVASLIILS